MNPMAFARVKKGIPFNIEEVSFSLGLQDARAASRAYIISINSRAQKMKGG
jgi:hypothetical protein